MLLGYCTNCSMPKEEHTCPVLADDVLSLPVHEQYCFMNLHSLCFAWALVHAHVVLVGGLSRSHLVAVLATDCSVLGKIFLYL